VALAVGDDGSSPPTDLPESCLAVGPDGGEVPGEGHQQDVVPTFLRDLFGFRWALRYSTPQASDTILGSGWASQGYSATTIDPATRGVGLLLQEGGVPVRLRSCYLNDLDLADLARRAEQLRRPAKAEAPTLRLLDGTR
jgi:hypothetical protein